MTQFSPPMQPGMMGSYKPHRATLVLVLGILGLVLCVICGIIAWVMGNADLKEMDAGTMDPSGRGMTQAGKICGMVGCIINLVVVGLWILMVVGAIVTGAATSGGSPVGGP